jgi:ribosomal-protein-serine acetyltransferase
MSGRESRFLKGGVIVELSVIKIKKIALKDAEIFWVLLEDNRQYLERWMPRIKENTSLETNKKIIEFFVEEMASGKSLRCLVYSDSEPVGYVGIKIDNLNKNCNVAYWVCEKHRGRGIAKSAVKLMVEESFEKLNLNKIYLSSSTRNSASISVAKSLGFDLEGTLREHELLEDGYHDILLFSLLKKDWLTGAS